MGDVLVVVTDGLTEVTDRRGREVGLEGIESVLAAHAEEPLERPFQSRFVSPQDRNQSLECNRASVFIEVVPSAIVDHDSR